MLREWSVEAQVANSQLANSQCTNCLSAIRNPLGTQYHSDGLGAALQILNPNS